jgi:endonuclease-3
VLTFAMGRSAFPVDTHVHRVAVRLGWVPAGATAERAHDLLRALVPPDVRYDLHMALIAHGRAACRARRPACGECVLRRVCAAVQ